MLAEQAEINAIAPRSQHWGQVFDKGFMEDGEARYKIPFEYSDDVVKLVVSRCTESESGGRMIDAILTNTVLPDISREFLTRVMQGEVIESVQVSTLDGNFQYGF